MKHLFILFIFSVVAFGDLNNGLHLTTMMGCSFSGKSPLQIQLSNGQSETIQARYNNRCFDDSHWWSVRLDQWNQENGFGIELIHHKIYLANTTDLIESFSISDGYNLLLFNLGKQKGKKNYRVGFGVVLAHMDITIAGRDRYIKKGLNGHYLTGPAFQINMEQLLWESNHHFISLDTKFTAAYASVPVSSNQNEYAVAPDYALHFSIGFGSKPSKIRSPDLIERLGYFLPLAYPAATGFLLGTGMLP